MSEKIESGVKAPWLNPKWANLLGRFLALIIVFAFFALLVQNGKFYTLRNLENILRQSCVYGTAGLGMTMIIIAAGIYFSRGSLPPPSVLSGAGGGGVPRSGCGGGHPTLARMSPPRSPPISLGSL